MLLLILLSTWPLFLWWFYFSLLFLSGISLLFTYYLLSEFLYFSFALILQRDFHFFKVLFCLIFKFMAQCSITIFVSFTATLFCFSSHELFLPSFWFSLPFPYFSLVIFFFFLRLWASFLYHCSGTATSFSRCLLEIHVGKDPGTCSRTTELFLMTKDFIGIFIHPLHFFSQWTQQLWWFP